MAWSRSHPGPGFHLAPRGTTSGQGHQSPSASTAHENRKLWDKILRLPPIVTARLFSARRRHPAVSPTLPSATAVPGSPPHPPSPRAGQGAAEGAFLQSTGRQGLTATTYANNRDLALAFQGKPRGLSAAVVGVALATAPWKHVQPAE